MINPIFFVLITKMFDISAFYYKIHQAISWYLKAPKNGDNNAMYNLVLYLKNKEISKNQKFGI